MKHLLYNYDKEKFKTWLEARGCEVLPTTNQYEWIRFKGREIGVVYTTGKTSNLFTDEALLSFRNNKKWDGSPINTGRYSNYKREKEALIKRDGRLCFLCGKEMGDDITVEHLISLVWGGKNTLANMVLMHSKCNESVGTKPISEKVKLAIHLRLKNQ